MYYVFVTPSIQLYITADMAVYKKYAENQLPGCLHCVWNLSSDILAPSSHSRPDLQVYRLSKRRHDTVLKYLQRPKRTTHYRRQGFEALLAY